MNTTTTLTAAQVSELSLSDAEAYRAARREAARVAANEKYHRFQAMKAARAAR